MSVTRHQAVGAYRLWRPPSFDENGNKIEQPEETDTTAASAAKSTPPPAVSPPPAASPSPGLNADDAPDPPIKLPTADEIEAMFEQARSDGLAAGHSEGRAKAAAEAARFAALHASMNEALTQIDGEIADEIVALAIAVAKQVVKHTLADHPAAIADTVREALQQLPQGKGRIHIHPDDAALVREYLNDQLEHGHHELLEDDSMLRGGCKVESSGCQIDATLETRWHRVLQGLGRGDTSWDDEE